MVPGGGEREPNLPEGRASPRGVRVAATSIAGAGPFLALRRRSHVREPARAQGGGGSLPGPSVGIAAVDHNLVI